MVREIEIGDVMAAIEDDHLSLDDGYGDIELTRKETTELIDWLNGQNYP